MAKSPSSNSVEVFAGENITVPDDMILSITVIDTPEDAVPTMTSDLASMSLSASVGAIAEVVSPESATTGTTSLPSTPPAALMSWIARSEPANSGGPRNARLPVCGRSCPMVRVPSPLAAAFFSGSSEAVSPPQAARVKLSAKAPAPAVSFIQVEDDEFTA